MKGDDRHRPWVVERHRMHSCHGVTASHPRGRRTLAVDMRHGVVAGHRVAIGDGFSMGSRIPHHRTRSYGRPQPCGRIGPWGGCRVRRRWAGRRHYLRPWVGHRSWGRRKPNTAAGVGALVGCGSVCALARRRPTGRVGQRVVRRHKPWCRRRSSVRAPHCETHIGSGATCGCAVAAMSSARAGCWDRRLPGPARACWTAAMSDAVAELAASA